MARTRNADIGGRDAAEASQASQEPNPEEFVPVLPKKFSFSTDQFGKIPKLQSRCEVYSTVNFLQDFLTKNELRWFKKHPQFKHVFHMERQMNHRLVEIWMLMLRTVETKKKEELWFVLNGVPIRYSIREHALISGFICDELPRNYKKIGSYAFVHKWFKRTDKIYKNDVKEILMTMSRGDDRLKMAVLYFLSTVIKVNARTQMGSIDSFILKVVDDLKECERFPWGRYTFNDNLKKIHHMLKNNGGVVPKNWTFPGFILPLQVLAFECVPKLNQEFREPVENVSEGCPLMCKSKFRSRAAKGFRLDELYDELGTTMEITSVLDLNVGSDDDVFDPVVDSWVECLKKGNKICWESLHEADVMSRTLEVQSPSLVLGLQENSQPQSPPQTHEMQTPQQPSPVIPPEVEQELKKLKDQINCFSTKSYQFIHFYVSDFKFTYSHT